MPIVFHNRVRSSPVAVAIQRNFCLFGIITGIKQICAYIYCIAYEKYSSEKPSQNWSLLSGRQKTFLKRWRNPAGVWQQWGGDKEHLGRVAGVFGQFSRCCREVGGAELFSTERCNVMYLHQQLRVAYIESCAG